MVAPDQDRHRPGRHWRHLDRRHVEHMAVVLEKATCTQAPYDVELLVHAPAPSPPWDVTHRVVLGPRAGADAQEQTVVSEDGSTRHLLRHQQRMPERALE